MNPSQRIQKKYEQKNVLPARARDIYHPSYTFSSAQYRRYNTASALPPGGDPSQRVRVLKATFHHWGRTIFLRARYVGVFVFFVFLMRGFQWVCGILLPKFFVRTSTILYGRECLHQKFFLSFLFFFQKWSQILYKTS